MYLTTNASQEVNFGTKAVGWYAPFLPNSVLEIERESKFVLKD
jgi:hypothetical protein